MLSSSALAESRKSLQSADFVSGPVEHRLCRSITARYDSGSRHADYFAQVGLRMTRPDTDVDLTAVLARYGIHLPDDQLRQLDRYRQLLWQWNERLNLTRHLDVESFAARDVLDSWQLAQLLQRGERVLDIGTGGGVPGVMVGILRPDVQMVLCESVGKKAAAVQSIVEQLGLPITVYSGRAEKLLANQAFDTAMARAVGPLWKVLKGLQPHWGKLGRLLLVKGPKWTAERGEARHRGYLTELQLRRLASYCTPGHYGESVILSVYPRAAESQLSGPSRKPHQ
jgi:16S rRNA (guanine527-N7)-methyltransferase